MSLDQIIDIQISRETSAVSQAGFGTGNFLSNDSIFLERIKEFSSYTAMSQDPLVGADALAFGQKYFGQEIRPQKLYITKKGRDLVRLQTIDFDADFITGNGINLKINGVAVTQTNFTTDHATTLAALAANIQSDANVDTATVTGARQITVTGLTVDNPVAITELIVSGGVSQAVGTVTVTQYEDGLLSDQASLVEAQGINNDWYALAMYNRTAADIIIIAAWIQAQRNLFFTCSDDSDVLTTATTDVASSLKTAGYDRTIYMWSADQANYPEAAWMGGNLPLNPGSITWAFKSLSGITYDALTDTEKSNAQGKNANVYTLVGGASITQDGKTSEGTFIDIIRGIDWIQARMQENIYSALVNSPKIPFTDAGVNIVVNRMSQILDQAEVNTIITNDPKYSISAPLVSSVSVNDRANRILPDVTFEAVLAGAIHKITIRGTVSV